MCVVLSIMLSAILEISVYLMFRDAEYWVFVDILYADVQVRFADTDIDGDLLNLTKSSST